MHGHRITVSVADKLFTITTQPLHITAVIYAGMTCLVSASKAPM